MYFWMTNELEIMIKELLLNALFVFFELVDSNKRSGFIDSADDPVMYLFMMD